MDILAIIKKDHENVLLLFDELDQIQTGGGEIKDNPDQVFDQLRRELELHATGEEEFFYPPLAEDEDIRPMALEAIEEHHLVKQILAEMGGMPKNDQWRAKLAVLREMVEQHIEKEEEDLFPNAEGIMSSGQIRDLGNRMAEMKAGQTAGVK